MAGEKKKYDEVHEGRASSKKMFFELIRDRARVSFSN